MASKICSLHIVNKKGKTRAIARSVVGPNDEGLVHFYTLEQVEYAQKLEEEQEIELKTAVPNFIQDQINEKKRVEEKFPMNPVSQVRAAFEDAPGSPVTAKNNPEGWNSPNQAYRGQDLTDRENGFAATSSNATKEDAEFTKETSDGEEANTTPESDQVTTSAWNSPDDAYSGEDLKDRDYDEEEREEAMESKNQEAGKFEERKEVGPQDQVDSATQQKQSPITKAAIEINAKEVKGDAADKKREEAKEDAEKSEQLSEQADEENAKTASEKGVNSSETKESTSDSKPDWYLSYEEVEGKNKGELQEWAENEVPAEESFKLNKSKNAKETKEEVHDFLAKKFEDHAE